MRLNIIVGMSLIAQSLAAGELVMPKSVAMAKGYTSTWEAPRTTSSTSVPYQHALDWPVEFRNGQNSLGNLMAQYQYFGRLTGEYFHQGCDLVAFPGSAVTSPVAGVVEAGYYTYAQPIDGHSEKLFRPIGTAGEENADYFEVAVIDDHGIRFEFHHIEPSSLSTEILTAIRERKAIRVGTMLGTVRPWTSAMLGQPYDHIHYNIIAPGGIPINCEAVSKLTRDTLPPVIERVFAIYPDRAVEVRNGESLPGGATEFVVKTSDLKDQSPFIHQPHFLAIGFASGHGYRWDFSKVLLMPSGVRPSLSSFYETEFTLDSGEEVYSSGNYNNVNLLNRIPVAVGANGSFTIVVKDAAANRATFTAILRRSER